jgi:hypothetical protein
MNNHHHPSAPNINNDSPRQRQFLQPNRQNQNILHQGDKNNEAMDCSPAPSIAPLFLNVTQHMMVRQSSDTTQVYSLIKLI